MSLGNALTLGGTQQTVDYMFAKWSANEPITTSPYNVTGFTVVDGNLTATAGLITLNANTKYELEFGFLNQGQSSPGDTEIAWVDTSNVKLPNSNEATTLSMANGSNNSMQPIARASITTGGAAQQIRLRAVNSNNNAQIAATGSYIIIKQVGSSSAAVLSNMVGATAVLGGASGLVPAPAAGDQLKVLSGAGTWVTGSSAYLLTAVVQTAAAVPTVAGVYSFAGVPTGGLPVGISLGDIATLAAGVWTQTVAVTAANIPPVVEVGSSNTTAAPYNLSNGIYVAAPLASANYFAKILNNVSAGTQTGPVAVSAWSAPYTARGGTVVLTADFTAYVSTANALHAVTMLRDGIVIDTRTFFVNTASQHSEVPTLRAILPNESGAHTYSISLASAMTVDGGDRCTMMVEEFGASVAVTGQTVDFVYAHASATQNIVAAGVVTIDVVDSGAIPFAANTATLPAGKTYLLRGVIPFGSTTNIEYRWFNVTTASFIGNTGKSSNVAEAETTVCEAVITPGVATQVRLEAVTVTTGGVIGLAAGNRLLTPYIMIQQLGSSAAAVLSAMTGATAGAAGVSGLTPANVAGTQNNPLYGDGAFGVSGRLTNGSFVNQGVNFTITNIDVVEGVVLNQTTVGITATVPNPAVVTIALRKRITNAGTASLKVTNSTATQTVLLAAGAYLEASWDVGGTAFNIGPASNVPLPVVQRFTSSGTYTPTFGMKYAIVELVGSGGGGGGAAAGAASVITIGGSGSGGGYAKAQLTAAQIGVSQVVTIGAAGTAGAAGANAGGSGNTTSLGALMSASGGTSGLAGATAGNFPVYAQRGQGGGNGAVVTGTLIVTRFGDSATGGFGAISGAGVAIQVGNGGGGPFGAGGIGSSNFVNVAAALNIVGNAAQGFGAGGSGGASAGTGSAAQAGGAGTAGYVQIVEFMS